MFNKLGRSPGARGAWLLALCLWLWGTACVLGQEPGNPARQAARDVETLARVGDQVITVDAFRAELDRLAFRDPSLGTDEGRRTLLEGMVRHRALVQSALDAGFAEHPDVVAAWERLLVSAYQRETWQRRLDEISVSDAEVADHYAAHAADYAIPARYQAAIIFYEIPAGATAEYRAKVEAQARHTLREAATLDSTVPHFGPLALRDSEHRASRYQGGVIGWLSPSPAGRSRWEPELLEAIFALREPGELSPPVTTPKGLYLVRLVAREDSRIQPLEQLSSGIRHRLLQDKQAALRRIFDAELVAELDISIDNEKLQAIEPSEVSPQLMPPALPGIADHRRTAKPGSSRTPG